jgi:hypothetical protein
LIHSTNLIEIGDGGKDEKARATIKNRKLGKYFFERKKFFLRDDDDDDDDECIPCSFHCHPKPLMIQHRSITFC